MAGVHYSQSYSSCHLKPGDNIHNLYGYKGLLVYNLSLLFEGLIITRLKKFVAELHLYMGLTTILILQG